VIFRIFKYLPLFPFAVFAFEIQRDALDAFVFADDVVSLNTQPCQGDVLFMPENASFFGSAQAPGIPFRTYLIALPSSVPPNVELENLKVENVNGKPCGAEQNLRSLQVGKPYLKDNLWRVKINVPLLYLNGNVWSVRRNFRVKVNYNGVANGYSVGKRALSQVENKNAAARFGTNAGAARNVVNALAKSSANGIDWLLKIKVGTADLSVPADGMYALSYEELKRIAGSEIDGILIDNLRLFSASPDTLPEMLGEKIFPNAKEIPIIVKQKDKSKRIFSSGDSVIFFGHGTALWKKSGSPSGMDYYFSHSPYSFYQYYYLGANGAGKKLDTAMQKNISGAKDIAWKKYARSEKEMLLRDNYFGVMEENTGKEWFWAWGVMGGQTTVNPTDFQNSVKNLPGLQDDSLFIGVTFFPRRSISANPQLSKEPWKKRMAGINFKFYFQNAELQNIIDTIFGGTFVFASKNAKAENNAYKLEFTSNGQNDRFDGLSVAYNYNIMQSAGDEWLFPGKEIGAVKIPLPANMELIKTVDFIPTEILIGEGYVNDIISNNADTKYFLHKKNSYNKTPISVEAIQNRKSFVVQPLEIPVLTEYLILTSEILQNSAAKLKRFREDGTAPTTFNTAVVLVEDIYREHGAQSSPVAIRDYIRYAKERCPNLGYVLLAGSGNYDYRKMRQSTKDNLLPPYEAEDIASDDFFAILDFGEAIRFGDYQLALAVGRIPVSSEAEFDNYIQKVMDYEKVSVMDNGIWRNTVIFSSDDQKQGSIDEYIPHTEQLEKTASLVDSLSRHHDFAIDWRKISLLQYDIDGSGKKPDAAKELLLRLNQGALFTMYYGHGGAIKWADEDLLTISSLSNLFNFGKYTILGSFSCEVARFDDASVTSLSESFVTAKSKGAIAAIGALRESYAADNENIAKKILSYSLFPPDSLLGDAILKAKQGVSYSYSSERYNNEKYALLGEPVLSMPMQKISMTLDNVPDTIQALQKLKISGEASVQSGSVRMQILEGERLRMLSQKRNDGTVYSTQIKVMGNPIYSEELQIKNGKFSTEFITPRKLSLGDNSAQIRLWGYKPGTAGIGRYLATGISLYGTSADLISDNTPPSIKIYPCMRFGVATPYSENARVSLEMPACLDVVIEDSTGIDYREEADEGISFELSPIVSSWHPWSFSEQTSKRAVARINFTSYEAGEYIFKVKAQDIFGNAAVRSIRLVLNQENNEGLADIFNAPNPMKRNGTTFYFKDLSGDRQSSVSIKIFDQNGKLVKTINNAISGRTHWDGRDSRGRLLANGLYHYIVQNTVYSLEENSSRKIFEKKQKLVISR
jgi:hypothetical protein